MSCFIYLLKQLYCLYFVLSLCYSEFNVALNKKCLSSLKVTSANCYRLVDGSLSGSSDHLWAVGDNKTGHWVKIDFNATCKISKVIFHHSWEADQRNIMTVNLKFEAGSPYVFQLINTDQNNGDVQDEILFDPPVTSNSINMTITVIRPNTYFYALKEIEALGSLVSIANTSPILSVLQTTPSVTELTSADFESTMKSQFTSPWPDRYTTAVTDTTESSTTQKTSPTVTTPPTIRPSPPIITTLSTTTSQKSPTTDVSKLAIIVSSTALTTNDVPVSIRASTEANVMASQGGIVSSESPENSDTGMIVGVVIALLVIIVVILVVVLLLVRRRQSETMNDQTTSVNVYVNMGTIEHGSKAEPDSKKQILVVDPPKYLTTIDSSPETSPESPVQDLKPVDSEPEYANTQPLAVYSNAIQLDELASTVDDMLQKPTMIQEEFKSIPAGKQHPTTFADRSTLHVKNRFRNIKPYDHSRVSLIQKESDDSMYINANFISAYNQPKYYIAAQGPNKDSVDDFWRMIWEHRVAVIVMVTNCKEAGKDKCTKYWPDQGDDKQTYDDLDVVFDKNSIMADYKTRDFKISKRGEIRAVRQYHYTSWPDEGVPTSCSALISFVNRIREYTDDKDPPNVVHCSAGVGRTGTFIAVNYSMDMAREESIVDIKKVVHRLREDRINMVQTLSQYKFLYALMLECLYCGEVTIPCRSASEKIQHLFIQAGGKYSQAEKQSKVLDVFKPKNWEDECLAGRHKDNIEKNRTQTILPHDNHRPYLRRRPDYTSNYINAVFVDGYKKKNKFLLTQHPLENTVVDLWRTVSDFNISTIVMLNSCSDDEEVYWPEDEYSEALQYGDFLEVTFKRVDKQDEFTITEVQLFEDKEKANVVTHIQVKNWSEDSKPKLSILPALYNIVTQAQMTDEDSRIMIHNLNGDGNTGVYCALHQIFDKIKEEQEIDIFNAVKNTRMSRPDAIPDMETYRYLHDASVQFIEQFSTYANFQ